MLLMVFFMLLVLGTLGGFLAGLMTSFLVKRYVKRIFA
jgi:hypothetical protein